MSRPITVTLPDKSVVKPIYNEANSLESLQIKKMGEGNFVIFLENQDYDAKGQRQSVKYGNGAITKYFYDPKTFRLTDLITKLDENDQDSEAIQNIKYTYDPAGK